MLSRGRNPSVGLALALALAPTLNSCMAGGDDYRPACTTEPPPPTQYALDPDSLVFSVHSRSDHYFKSAGNSDYYSREFFLDVSRTDDLAAFAYFDSSGLSLYANDVRIPTPPPTLSAGGFGTCPSYSFMLTAGVGGTGPDTSFTLQVKKAGVTVRSWEVEYKFDDTKPPEFSAATYATGLTAILVLKPDAVISAIAFVGETISSELPYQRTGDTVRIDIAFQKVDALHMQLDSASLNSANFQVCAMTSAGYESTVIDGVVSPGAAGFCWELEGEARAKVVEYEKHYCRNCK